MKYKMLCLNFTQDTGLLFKPVYLYIQCVQHIFDLVQLTIVYFCSFGKIDT